MWSSALQLMMMMLLLQLLLFLDEKESSFCGMMQLYSSSSISFNSLNLVVLIVSSPSESKY